MTTVMTVKASKKYRRLIEVIPKGRSDAISLQTLCRCFNFSERVMKGYILKARKDGVLICSADKGENTGYYFPGSHAELKEYVNRRKDVIRTSCVALAPFRRKLKKIEAEDQTKDED